MIGGACPQLASPAHLIGIDAKIGKLHTLGQENRQENAPNGDCMLNRGGRGPSQLLDSTRPFGKKSARKAG